MKESLNSFLSYCCMGLMGLNVFAQTNINKKFVNAETQSTQISTKVATTESKSHPELVKTSLLVNQPVVKINQPQRTLSLAITVDDPSFLKVQQGDEITVGQVISDNTIERDRLNKQRSAIELQINNLKSKDIPKPAVPEKLSPSKVLPSADYTEEKANISQARMKLVQAQSILAARTPMLRSDNPERRAEVEKAEAQLQLHSRETLEQEQLLQAMKDQGMEQPIIEHESAKLRQISNKLEQAKSTFEREKASLNASAIEQQQQLQQLQLNVEVAQKELELADSRLVTAKSKRKMLEYDASVRELERKQRAAQLQQEYSRQQLSYAQSVRERDYQLAQLNLSLSAIDDKLSLIPVVKAPRNGYIRRVKPWVGNNGKYTTTVIISSTPNKLSSGDRQTNITTKQ